MLSVFTVLFSGCVQYQYLTLASNIPKNNEGEFIIENDTLLVKYKFSGLGGPVQIYAYNKLNKPLYIDWNKSAIIIGDHSQSYVTGTATLKGTYNGSTYGLSNNRSPYGGNYGSNYGRLSGVIQTEKDLSFIPPKTYIDERRLLVKSEFLALDPALKHRINIPTAIGTASAKYVNFDQAASPLQFRSFLTVSANEDLSHSFHFENSFWVSKVIETITSPKEIGFQPTNQFYNRKSTGVGETFTVIGLLVLLGIGIANSPHH